MTLLFWFIAILGAGYYFYEKQEKEKQVTKNKAVEYKPVRRRPKKPAQANDSGLQEFTIKAAGESRDVNLPATKPQNKTPQNQQAAHHPDRVHWVDDDDDDDDLLSFQVSYGGSREVKSKNQQPGVFKAPGEAVSVGSHTITGGLFYFGGQLPKIASAQDYYGAQTESSLLDDTLPVEDSYPGYEDDSLGYWPQYNSISPECRGAYIAWLSGSRNQPDTPLGYVFIYFYGLERRVLVDHGVDNGNDEVSDEQLRLIHDEVCRLREVYGESRSFYNYATRLIEYIVIIAPQVAVIEEAKIEPHITSLLFRYYLAKTVDAGEPLSPTLAFIWLQAYPEYRFRTPARRCIAEFEQLFIYTQAPWECFFQRELKTL